MNTPRLHRAVLLLLAIFLTHSAVAEERQAASAARHPLWKVQGRTNTVYLLGSIHLLKRENYPLAAPIESAFSNSLVVGFETDLEKMEQPEIQFKMLSRVQLPEGETLKQQLSAEVYASFTKHAADAGVSVVMLDRFKPTMAALTLEIFELQKLGADPEFGVDKYFFERARKAGKMIVPFETVDFQIGLLTDFTREEGELMMKTTLEEIDHTRKSYNEMLTAWENGDAAALEKLLNEADQQSPAIFKRLVTDRNVRWIPVIEEFLRGPKNAIVIVGAGHLVGAEGVVELLRKKGLKVTQL